MEDVKGIEGDSIDVDCPVARVNELLELRKGLSSAFWEEVTGGRAPDSRVWVLESCDDGCVYWHCHL